MSGTAHSADWKIEDAQLAYVAPGIAMAMTAADLLANGAEVGLRIVDEFEPALTKDEYLAHQRSTFRTELYSAE